MSLFSASIDEGCQRGLHVRYELHAPVPAELHRALRAEFGAQLRLTEERFGPQVVHRALCPFRFEVRHGHRPQAISLILRFTASEAQRAGDRAAFDALLSRTLTAEKT